MVDTAIATGVAEALVAALGAVSTAVLLREIFRWSRQRRADGLNVPDAPTVRNRMRGMHRLVGALGAAIRYPLHREAYPQGWVAGQRSAAARLASGPGIALDVDWSGWVPGDSMAARKLIDDSGSAQGFRDLLRDSDVTIKGIVDTRLDALARVLADGLERGTTPQALARDVRDVLEDPTSALSVAWTEASRAISAAAMDEYSRMGVTSKGWMTAHDERVCAICYGNAAAGLIPLGASFPSGDPHPPGHPRCRCAPEPGSVI